MAVADTRRAGLLAMVGGALFVPYALLKGPTATTIVETGAHLPGTTADRTALIVHLSEAIPFLLLAAGFYAVYDRSRESRTRAGTLGAILTGGGYGMVLLFHVAEHVMTPGEGPLPADVVASIGWGYYAGWLVMLAGLALFGFGIRRTAAVAPWVPWLLVATLPVGVGVGLAVVALDLYTYAGTQRLVVGLAWSAVGYRLWSSRPGVDDHRAPARR